MGIANSLLTACELQIRKNGFYFIPALQMLIFTASELQIWKDGVSKTDITTLLTNPQNDLLNQNQDVNEPTLI